LTGNFLLTSLLIITDDAGKRFGFACRLDFLLACFVTPQAHAIGLRSCAGLLGLPEELLLPTKGELRGCLDWDAKDVFAVHRKALVLAFSQLDRRSLLCYYLPCRQGCYGHANKLYAALLGIERFVILIEGRYR
jgi:hypothetical protein